MPITHDAIKRLTALYHESCRLNECALAEFYWQALVLAKAIKPEASL